MPTNDPNRAQTALMAEAVERLQVRWIVMSLVLLVLVVLVTLVGAGRLRKQSRIISQQTAAIEDLRARLDQTRDSVRELEQTLANLRAESAPPRDETPAQRPPQAAAAPAEPEQPTEPDERRLLDRLSRVLQTDTTGAITVSDRQQARRLLTEALARIEQADWSGVALARLSVLALLLDENQAAEVLANRAARAGTAPLTYYELSTRRLLAAGNIDKARVEALRFARAAPANSVATVLLACAQRAAGQLAQADQTLTPMPSPEGLDAPDRLRLADVLAELQRWDDLERAIASMHRLPGPEQFQLNQLRAVLALQRGRIAEGLAILDALLGIEPDNYDVRTWRAVALLKAGQYDAAYSATRHAESHPDRPDAWYWRGRIALAQGRPDDAEQWFNRALASDARHAPTLETLGSLALNGGELEQALRLLTQAVEAQPRRASAQFVLAVAYAKVGRRAEAEQALGAALRLDPNLLDAAQDTEALRALFSLQELQAMASTAQSRVE